MLAVALGLVFGIARLLGGSASGDPDVARPVGSEPTGSSSSATPRATPTTTPDASPTKSDKSPKEKRPTKTPTPLAAPTGPCADDDVQITPELPSTAYAGRDVVITLNLTTLEAAACNWRVGPKTVVVKLTSGSDRIWSTQDCAAFVPQEAVVLRKGEVTPVDLVWNGQRSEGSCLRNTDWALPGYYHVEAAAYGSNPLDVQFELESPTPRTVTATPKPKPKDKSDRDD